MEKKLPTYFKVASLMKQNPKWSYKFYLFSCFFRNTCKDYLCVKSKRLTFKIVIQVFLLKEEQL